ncbi:MAG: hypothetical protein ACXVSJ_15950 [Solirubrobacteraceae bacterium]
MAMVIARQANRRRSELPATSRQDLRRRAPAHPDGRRTEMEFGPGDVAIIDPGHDGWVVGDEPNVLFELADATREE